jgi:hypothetical protein
MLLPTLPRCISSHSKYDVPDHYAIVLAYACKHGYMDLADMAAPLTVVLPQADVVALLTPAAVLPYVRLPYYLSGVILIPLLH